MSISFNSIPITLRTPGVFAEFDASKAVQGVLVKPYRALLIGQRRNNPATPTNVPYLITRTEQGETLFGKGSMLDRMVKAWRANNQTTALYAMCLAENGAGVVASGTLLVTGPAQAAGTINLYIAGQRIQVAVASGASAATIHGAIVAAINADTNLPVTAAGASPTITLSAGIGWKGELGNSIDLRFNYYPGETFPPGVTVQAVAPMSGGTTNPDLTATIAAMGDDWYDLIVCPYLDSANLALMKTELDDRWGPLRQIEGHVIAARRDSSVGNLTSWGASQNDPHLTVFGDVNGPTPPYELAAAAGAVISHYLNIDPARPLQTLQLKGLRPAVGVDQLVRSERNLLLYDGIATHTVDADGTMRLDRAITTYQTNAAGGDDPSYLDIETMFTLGFLRYSLRARFLQKFPRHKIANDGTRFGAGQAVITPKIAKAECFTLFRQWEELGLVENFDQFKADIVVERSATDPNRLDLLLPPDLINQLRVTAVQIGFRL